MTPRLRWALLLAAMGCGLPACAPEGVDENVVARFEGGEVTREELEEAILRLPVEERRPPDGDFAAWEGEIARELATRELLLAEARRRGLGADPDFAARMEEIRRRTVVGAYLREEASRPPEFSKEELRRAFEGSRDDYRRPAARLVLHLFRRLDGGDPEALREEMEELRLRALGGEPFGALAEAHSDSELRHRRGVMGWVRRGNLSADFDAVVFSLPEKFPSAPVRTREGLHLFWVETAVEAKEFSFEEARGMVAARLRAEWQGEVIRDLVTTELPEGSFVPRPEELEALLAGGAPQSLMLRLGDFEMRLDEFRHHFQEVMGEEAAVAPELARSVLESLLQRELLYRQIVATDRDRTPAVERTVARRAEEELVRRQREAWLLEEVAAEEETLRDFHAANSRRYGTPLRLRIVRLSIPLGDSPDRLMRRLEGLASKMADQSTLEAAAQELDGEVTQLGWQTLDQLRRLGPTASRLAVDLEPGQLSPPYRTGHRLELLHLLERRDPEPLPFEQVADRVAQDYLSEHAGAVYRREREELLEEHSFRLSPSRVSS